MAVRIRVHDDLELIKKRALAKLLSVNPWTIDNWRKRGLLPQPVKLGPHVVAWRRREIEEWLDEHREAC